MTPRSRAEDAERKRLARLKLREAKEARRISAAQAAEDSEAWRSRLDREMARLIEKVEYYSDPQRDVEFVAACVRWIADAERAAGDDRVLIRISQEIRTSVRDESSMGRVSFLQLPSWTGLYWGSVADIRTVLMTALADRGLTEIFERTAKGTL
jgi:hypothetical protein